MSNIGNRETFSKNLKFYMDKSGMDRRELAEIWGFPYSTVSEWLNAKKYPRIDRIEKIADYFGILKSDLIEERNEHTIADDVREVISRMKTDRAFFDIVVAMSKLNSEKLNAVKKIIEIVQ